MYCRAGVRCFGSREGCNRHRGPAFSRERNPAAHPEPVGDAECGEAFDPGRGSGTTASVCLTLLAEIRVAHYWALTVIRDCSRMPLPGNIEVRLGRSGQGVEVHDPVETPE